MLYSLSANLVESLWKMVRTYNILIINFIAIILRPCLITDAVRDTISMVTIAKWLVAVKWEGNLYQVITLCVYNAMENINLIFISCEVGDRYSTEITI